MNIKKYLNNIESLANRNIALSGATSGIGYQLAKHLLCKNASLILLARNPKKVNDTINKLKEIYPNSNIDYVIYDQSSFLSIEKGIDELINKNIDIDTIILNAGVLTKKGRSKEDYPLTFGVNYLGVRHFIEYYASKVNRKTRFVIQGSIVAGLSIPKNYDSKSNKYTSLTQYNVSKIYLEAYIHYLYINNIYPNYEFIISEPGVSGTNIISDLPSIIRILGRPAMKVIFQSPKKSSLTALIGVTNQAKNGDLITPRGLFTIYGYPKIKRFPLKRERKYLFEKE